MGQTRRSFLFVLEYYPPHIGGVEVLFANLAESLAAAGHRVTVLTMRVRGSAARERRGGVDVVRLWVPPVAARYFFTFLAIPYALLLGRRADLIHTTTYNAALPGWLASLVCGVPSVLTVHEVFAEQWHRLPRLNPLIGYAFRLYEWFIINIPFTHFICDSDFTRRRLARHSRVDPRRISVVYPAVDYAFWWLGGHRARALRERLEFAPDTPIYLYFGRPGVSKGVEDLVSASRIVSEHLPDAKLVLLLSRAPASGYRHVVSLIDRLKLRDHVVVLDPVPREELPGYLLAADCVVIPSISEGFGYAAVEAATIGCRVIATTGHAVEEVVGASIIPVPPRSPKALAATIIHVLEMLPPTEPAAPLYDTQRHLQGIDSIYQMLLSRHNRHRANPEMPSE